MMQPLDLNLASRPFRNNTLLWIAYVGSAVLLAGFTAWNWWTYGSYRDSLAELQSRVVSYDSEVRELELQDRAARAGIEEYDLDALTIQALKANEVIAWKAFSWTRLLNLMEQVLPWDVKMVSVRPLFHGGARRRLTEMTEDPLSSVPIALEGLAKSYEAFTELEQALQGDPHFGRVEPGKLNRTKTGEILFELQFLYAANAAVGEPAEGARVAEATPEEQPGDAGAEPADGEDLDAVAAAEEPPDGDDSSAAEPEEQLDAPAPDSAAAEGAAPFEEAPLAEAPAGGERRPASDRRRPIVRNPR